MNRIERKLLQLNERIAELRAEERLVAGELEMHEHLDDDARRDATVYGTPIERLNAYDTSVDVQRFRRVREDLLSKIARLETKRDRLVLRLGRP